MADTAPEDPLLGTPYRTLRRLAQGGMGEVVLVEHRELGKKFVAKLLLAEFEGDARLVDRMRVEARILGALKHPNIVEVFSFDLSPSGRPYLVMEHLRGCTLSEHLRQHGNLPVLEAVRAVDEMLAGLEAAHAKGIVHRDLKLSNLFLTEMPAGRLVKVLDFGIGKVLSSAALPKPQYPTEEGVMVGTPRYASPEQITGQVVDARSDLYSAGLVAYTLLAGRGPFDDTADTRAVLRAHLSTVPAAPSLYCPAPIPVELDQVVLKALEKRPADRFQTAAEMRDALALVADLLRAPVGYAETTTWDVQQLHSTRHPAPGGPESQPPAAEEPRAAQAEPLAEALGDTEPQPAGAIPPAPASAAKPGARTRATPPTLVSPGSAEPMPVNVLAPRHFLAIALGTAVLVGVIVLSLGWLL